MPEIGGYIELDRFGSNSYHNNLIELNLARNALAYIIDAKKIKKIYMPYFLCEIVDLIENQVNISKSYYHIDENFCPCFTDKLDEDEYLYICNFYGQLSRKKIKQLKETYNNVIVDNVQAFFEKPVEGIDTIYSCRKFFGVPDGAYLSTNKFIEQELDVDESSGRLKHIIGRYEEECASEYYNVFKETEGSLRFLPTKKMSKITKNIMAAENYDLIKQTREKNWDIVDNSIGKYNLLKVVKPVGPYMYPLLCRNGNQIRKRLIDKKIYIPLLWPNVLENGSNDIEKQMAENILPLPIDQRYGEEEMRYMINEVMKCLDFER